MKDMASIRKMRGFWPSAGADFFSGNGLAAGFAAGADVASEITAADFFFAGKELVYQGGIFRFAAARIQKTVVASCCHSTNMQSP
jgi:hypothetical protein